MNAHDLARWHTRAATEQRMIHARLVKAGLREPNHQQLAAESHDRTAEILDILCQTHRTTDKEAKKALWQKLTTYL